MQGIRTHGLRELSRRLHDPDMEPATEASPSRWPGEPVRLVRCRHDACGADTRVRLPRVRVRARRCGGWSATGAAQAYECEDDGVLDVGVARPDAAAGSRVPGWLSDPDSPRLALPEHPDRRRRGDRRA